MITRRADRTGLRDTSRRLALSCLALGATACAGGATPPGALEVSCPQALLRLEQITAPGFEEEAPVSSGGPATRGAQASRDAGPAAASEVRYFRPTRDLATSNGPVEISASAACYRDRGRASDALAAFVRVPPPGEVAMSPGPLGDESQASRRRATLPSGTVVAQITVRWRLASVLNTVTVRGREGAFGLGEVLTLASRQQENELAIETAMPASRRGPSPTPS